MENSNNITNNQKKFIISLIKLNKYKFFPGETIEGKISIQSNKNIQSNNTLENTNISFSLKQNMIYKANEFNFAKDIEEKKEENKLNTIKELSINHEDLKGNNFEVPSEIPFQFPIPPIQNNNISNFFPSLRFISPKLKCFIIHTLTIEIPGETNKCKENIFIRKIPNKTMKQKDNNKDNNENLERSIFKDEVVKLMKIFNSGKISYFIKIKNSFKYNCDNISLEIHLNETALKKVKVKNINIFVEKVLTLNNSYRFFKEKLSEKKISLLKDKKNTVIKEIIQVNQEEFPDLPIEEIQKKYKKIIDECNDIENNEYLFKEKMLFNFTPPIDTELFKVEYLVNVLFDFNNPVIEDKKIVIPIDLYDGDFDNLNISINNNNNDNNEENIFSINNENSNNIDNINDKNNNIINNEINNNENDVKKSGFVVYETQDFLDIMDGKNINDKSKCNNKNKKKNKKHSEK